MVAEKHIFLSVYNFFWIELNSDVAKGEPPKTTRCRFGGIRFAVDKGVTYTRKKPVNRM